jgi:hypothetical protein
MAAMPLGTISGARRTANREAGAMPASLASLKVEVEKARCGGRAPAISAPEGCGQASAASSIPKTKGRLWAAEVETTAEDIDSSEDFRERRGLKAAEAYSLFIRLLELCSGRLGLSSRLRLCTEFSYECYSDIMPSIR